MSKYINKIKSIYKTLRYQEITNIKNAEELDSAKSSIKNIKLELESIKNSIAKNTQQIDEIPTVLEELNRKINILGSSKHTLTQNNNVKQNLADNHLLDKFYVSFEDVFRGKEEDIYERLNFYLPYLKKAIKANPGLSILDIGCGRGEFLKLAKNNNIDAVGLDLNAMMIKRAKKNGFKAIEEHAQTYLLRQKSKSLAGITGFHIVEHIQFDELLTLFSECYRVLNTNGILIFETPNPENLQTAAWKFYYDPSHLHPLPPEMLKFAIETVGFKNAKIERLHPIKEEYNEIPDGKDVKYETMYRLYGPQDYSIIATK